MQNGTILNGTYQVLYPIASGGLGDIYLGYHLNLNKYLVIKKVKEYCLGLVNNRIEVDILKKLHHTYLPQVYDFIQIGTEVFTVMDYISGHDLKYYLDQGIRFTEDQLVLWLKQLCQVLDYLHNQQYPIMHCDIKPGNIMITDQGNVCLIDFNISLDGENNKDLIGLSSMYASPEQVRKAEYKLRYGSGDQIKIDGRTDLYSMGAVFYYAMTGIIPNGRLQTVIPLKEMEHGYSDALANIVDKAMEKDVSRRFKGAAQMLEALEHKECWSKEYRKLIYLGFALDVVTGCLGILLVLLMVLGYQGMKRDEFFQKCENFAGRIEEWQNFPENEEAQKLEKEGIQLLNNSDYRKQFLTYPEEKASILYGVSCVSLFLEDYFQAEKYLEDALSYEETNPLLYRDLAFVQVHLGELAEAEDAMEKALQLGLPKSDGMLIQAEIALKEEHYDKAWEYGCEAAESEDQEILTRVSVVLVETGEQLGKTEECIQFFNRMAEQSHGLWKNIWLRKEGELCMKVGENGKEEYLDQARICLEELFHGGEAQLTDLYNLASVYDSLDKLEEEKALLLKMEKKYPEEYKIYIRLAYVCYRMENDRTVKISNYKEVESYYKKAVRRCEQQGIAVENEASILQMRKIIEQLKEKGWLENQEKRDDGK